MVQVYRVAVYLIMIGAALLLYLLLRRLFGNRTRIFPVVAALLAATGLIWCTHFVLARPALLVKYAPFLKIKKTGAKMNMVLMEMEARICRADGSGDKLLLPKDFITTRDITWSPDGTRILCSRFRDSAEGMQLFIYDAIGQNPVQVTTGRGICRRPSWSPDGTRIVFDFRPDLRRNATSICVVNADGRGRKQLTDRDQIRAVHPVWSPDGSTIYCCVRSEGRGSDIWALDVDGGNLRQVTFTPSQAENELAIAPDGSTIAMSINREIYVMDANGGNLRPLTAEDGQVCRGRDPSWSSDSKRILFTGFGTIGSRRLIMEIGVDGSGLRQIAVQDGKNLTPILHPDGTRLAYLRSVQSVLKEVSAPRGLAGGTRTMGGDED